MTQKMFDGNVAILEEILCPPHDPSQPRVLGGVPGTGKSTSTIKFLAQYLRDNPLVEELPEPQKNGKPSKKKPKMVGGRVLYLTFYHELISEEIIPMFMREGISRDNIRHWLGIKRICPNRNIEPMRSMFDFLARDDEYRDDIKIPNNVICRLCMRLHLIEPDTCPHKLQFIDLPQVVVAPVQYTQTSLIHPHEFNFIVIDDVVSQINKYPSKRRINKWLKKIKAAGLLLDKNFNYDQLIDEVSKLEDDETPPSLDMLYLMQGIYLNVGSGEDYRYSLEWKGFNLIESMTPEMLKELALSFEIDLNDLRRIAYLRDIYGDREQFYESFHQRIFEYTTRTITLLIDAFPNTKFLKDQTNLFEQRTGRKMEFKASELPFKRNDLSTVIRVIGRVHGKNFWLPSQSFDKLNRTSTKRHVTKIMDAIFDTNPEGQPGFISFMSEVYRSPDWLSVKQLMRIDDFTLYYGGLRGQNKLQYCDWIILLGTYQTNKGELLKIHNGLYIDQINIDEVMNGGVKSPDGTWTYPDYPSLENLRQILDDNEMLQAIFRARPLNHNTKIYCICSVPEQMKLYCGYEERYIEDGDLTSDITIEQAIPYIFYESNPTNRDESEPVDEVLYEEATHRLSKITKTHYAKTKKLLKEYLKTSVKHRLSTTEYVDSIGRNRRRTVVVKC